MGLTFDTNDLVFVDTAPFIYYFEKHPDYFPFMEKFFDEIYHKDVGVITSMITFIEITTLPAHLKQESLVNKYRDFFTNSENISLFPIDLTIAEQTAKFRGQYQIKTPDAIQLATAVSCGVDYIITNDKEWQRVTDLPIIMVDEI